MLLFLSNFDLLMKFPCLVSIKIAKIIAIGEIWVQIYKVLADIVYCKLQEDKIFVIVCYC